VIKTFLVNYKPHVTATPYKAVVIGVHKGEVVLGYGKCSEFMVSTTNRYSLYGTTVFAKTDQPSSFQPENMPFNVEYLTQWIYVLCSQLVSMVLCKCV